MTTADIISKAFFKGYGITFQYFKTKEDVLRETGIELPDLITHKVEFSNQEELW